LRYEIYLPANDAGEFLFHLDKGDKGVSLNCAIFRAAISIPRLSFQPKARSSVRIRGGHLPPVDPALLHVARRATPNALFALRHGPPPCRHTKAALGKIAQFRLTPFPRARAYYDGQRARSLF
jgi:hypothetical protein